VRIGGKGTLERSAGWFIALLGNVFQECKIDDLAVDETPVVVTEIPAVNKQVARAAMLLEGFVGCDDQEIHV